jgi:hypothetical protein
MLVLSIRQPFAELILRGIKTVEYRSRPTKIIGERFWIYACQKQGSVETGSRLGVQWPVKKADNIVMLKTKTAWNQNLVVAWVISGDIT